jgi:hypothetical protein
MRIEWDPLDVAIATLVGGVVRIHEGTSVREHSRDVLDMRWLADGPILTIDHDGRIRSFRGDDVIEGREIRYRLGSVSIAAGGERLVAVNTSGMIAVESMTGHVFSPRVDGAPYTSSTAMLSGDGTRVAIAYATEQAGRGVAVFDVDKGTMLDRTYAAQPIDRTASVMLAFDHAGKRLALALPEVGVPALGVIRVATGEVYPRTMHGGATAVALEFRGNLVAYAHPQPPRGARGRLRFDYLDAKAKGEVVVDILDTQTLESELPDLVALAFSHDRRRLACLSSTGAIEIVPVP